MARNAIIQNGFIEIGSTKKLHSQEV